MLIAKEEFTGHAGAVKPLGLLVAVHALRAVFLESTKTGIHWIHDGVTGHAVLEFLNRRKVLIILVAPGRDDYHQFDRFVYVERDEAGLDGNQPTPLTFRINDPCGLPYRRFERHARQTIGVNL